jgi:uncharacterized flavoprotein (TIGR03862 family)
MTPHAFRVAIVGAGPAGLMAAEVLSGAGVAVQVFDAMPSVGRKFLLAGKGGLNLTHAEPFEAFVPRYGTAADALRPMLQVFGADQLRAWAQSLGVGTFVGTSQRVFPTDMKAAPLLRAWLQRLRHPGPGGVPVQFAMRHRWKGWVPAGDPAAPNESGVKSECKAASHLLFDTPEGPVQASFDAVVLAMGGGSWRRLGSDGAWVPWLVERGVEVAPLQPSNCGFDLVAGPWSEHFASRFAGQPFKLVAIRVRTAQGDWVRKGEFVATATGVEGSLIYAASALLRDHIATHGQATLELDLLPQLTAEQVLAKLQSPRGSKSLSSHLKSRLGLDGIKTAVLYECLSKEDLNQPERLVAAIKGLPVKLGAARPIDEAISSAGGVCWHSLDEGLMLKAWPGVYCAGEMVDWEAPTGGYLLTACLSSGRWAAQALLKRLGV